MKLGLSDDSLMLQNTFARFFEAESTPARVRAAEPMGFDAKLWESLVELGVPLMRVSADAGGGGMSLFDATLMMDHAGRRLAAAPIAEAVVATRILSECDNEVAREWVARAGDGSAILTVALHRAKPGKTQLVPGAAAATAIIVFDGEELAIVVPDHTVDSPLTLGGAAIGRFDPSLGARHVVATGAHAARIWSAGIEEWKLLTSAALIGLSQEALTMAATYASERIQFGVPIGSHQGISHPLANDVIDADAGGLLLSWTIRAVADGHPEAGATISMLWWWAVRTATRAVAHSLHTFGGYGLTNEYDIQLYHRRAKAWALTLGDPEDELLLGADRLLTGTESVLPDVGAVDIDFTRPAHAQALADETRALFESILTPELRAKAHYSFEGHDWGVSRAFGAAGLLYPGWPKKWGGREADADSVRASSDVWDDYGWTIVPKGVTGMIAHVVMKFGTPEVQQEVLPRMGAGEITACLGYTEPSCGSDVFAARTRAVRDGDDWVINGQKMFTSGAELASYVLLLTRTDPDVPKHKGLTLFLVPTDTPGFEFHPVYTFMDERTNATFYQDVRIPDRYRLGEVNGGIKVMGAALELEQSGGSLYNHMRTLAEHAIEWARDTDKGAGKAIDDPRVKLRLARAVIDARLAEVLVARVISARAEGQPDLAFGPAAKIFSTEAYIADSADLLDLAAPESLLRSRVGLGLIEEDYRHSTATNVYGGTSEVLRSMVAERRLGLPRSRM
ncbi:MAG: acyl-CoA dehydrogenase family protein [Micavibrio sp.]|nr:acyl-CoA dehydrogenase family protein [Micavibrio sp.]